MLLYCSQAESCFDSIGISNGQLIVGHWNLGGSALNGKITFGIILKKTKGRNCYYMLYYVALFLKVFFVINIQIFLGHSM